MKQLIAEIDKLAALGKMEISTDDVLKCASRSTGYDVFLLHDYMMKKKVDEAFALLKSVYEAEKTYIPLLALLAGKFRNMYIAARALKAGKSIGGAADEIVRITKSHPYPAKLAVSECRSFSYKCLKNSFKLLSDYEFALKTGGVCDDIETFMLKLYGLI